MPVKPHVWTEPQKAWVAALRSGEYTQGKGALKNTSGGHCCLGVACAISGMGAFNSAGQFFLTGEFYHHSAVLPPPVKEWLGLVSEAGGLSYPSVGSLSLRNDTCDWTFTDIANFIEECPERVFESS
jgi:hypothetical protein